MRGLNRLFGAGFCMTGLISSGIAGKLLAYDHVSGIESVINHVS